MIALDFQFWNNQSHILEERGVRLFLKNGIYCICGKGINPGDNKCFIRASTVLAYIIYYDLVMGREPYLKVHN